jgi:hypothetical protein
MSAHARRRNALTYALLAIFVCCITAGVTTSAATSIWEADDEGGYELSLAYPMVQQLIGVDVVTPEKQKFVQIAVTQVSNPKRIPLSFDIHFRPAHGAKNYLGSFSPYPADNPGKFIVATHGKLRTGGTVSVTLVPLQRVDDEEKIRVRLARLSFRLR